MKSLECLSKECIQLLHKNQLIQPLIKAELIEDLISKIKLNKEQEAKIFTNHIKKLGIKNRI